MTQTASRLGRITLWFLPPFVVVAAFFAALPWLKAQGDAVTTLAGAAASIFVMGYALIVSIRLQRCSDEVQRAGERFAFQAGGVGGWIAAILLLIVAPFRDLLIDSAAAFGGATGDVVDREAMGIAVMMGICLVVVLQTLGALIAGAVWRRRMGQGE